MQNVQINVVNFFENLSDGIGKLRSMLDGNLYTGRTHVKEKVQTVAYVCSDFDVYTSSPPSSFAREILSILKECSKAGVEVKVYSFAQLGEKLLKTRMDEEGKEHYYLYDEGYKINQKSYERKDGGVEVYSYHDTDNPLAQFFQVLKKLAKGNYQKIHGKEKDFESLNELAEFLVFDESKGSIQRLSDDMGYIDYEGFTTLEGRNKAIKIIQEANEQFYKELRSFKEKLKGYIGKLTECASYDDAIKPKIYAELNKAFENFKGNLEQAVREGDGYILRESVKFLVSLIDFTDVKASFRRYALPFILVDLVKMGVNINDFSKNKFTYTYLLPLHKLLGQDFAAYVSLCRFAFYSNFFIINDKSIIDFSGLSLFNSKNLKTNLYKGLGFSGSIDNGSFLLELIKGRKNSQSEKYLAPKHSDGKCSNCMVKLEPGPSEILPGLLSTQYITPMHLSFIEHPTFTSALFAQLLQGKNESARKDTSKNGQNYLIISNAPSFESAELDKNITQTLLNHEIAGGTKNKEPLGAYRSQVDYSHYFIDRKQSQNPSCIVRLSPFVCIKKEEYEGFRELVEKHENMDIYDSAQDENNTSISVKYPRARREFEYMVSFTQQARNSKEIGEKSKELFDNFIQGLQAYLDSFNMNRASVEDEGIYPQAEKHKQGHKDSYSLIELLCIAMSFGIVKKQLELFDIDYKIGSVERKTQSSSGIFLAVEKLEFYQAIQFDTQKLRFISQNAFVDLRDEQGKSITKRIFISKEFKKQEFAYVEDKDCVFLEDIARFSMDAKLDEDSDAYKKFQETISGELRKDLQENLEQESLFEGVGEKDHLISEEEYSELKAKFEDNFGQEQHKSSLEEYRILEQIFARFISAALPFTDYYNFNAEDCMKRLFKYTMENTPFKRIIKEELGLAYLAVLMSRIGSTLKKKDPHILIKRLTQIMIINEKTVIMYERLQEFGLVEGKHKKILAKSLRLWHFSVAYTQTYARVRSADFLQDVLKGLFLAWIDANWVNSYDQLKKAFEELIFRVFTYKYDEPYAVERKDFVTYPLSVQSKFMCLDFRELLYGGNLCTGGLRYHLGVSYLLDLPHENLRLLMVNKILSYILLDHHRHGQKIEDYIQELKARRGETFKTTAGTSKELDTYFSPRTFNDPKTYKLSFDGAESENSGESAQAQYELYRIHRDNSEKVKDNYYPIDAYNEALDILSAIYNGAYHSEKNENDKDKMRRLLECLEIIGRNNIKAMYVGIGDSDKPGEADKWGDGKKKTGTNGTDENDGKKKQPFFIGRLATTIIRDGGLWMG